MSKHYLSLLAFVTLLCMMLLGAFSCKKSDSGATTNNDDVDFFIDVDFLPRTETNGEVAPRMVLNFNDEVVMVEIRPSADTLMETILVLCPDNEAMLVCGNDSLMICAPYDLETYTPSNNVLLVTSRDDDDLLLTQCVMDWNTNTMTPGDMMVLPVDDNTKRYKHKGGGEDDMRVFFMNRFMKPLALKFEKAESMFSAFGMGRASMVFSTFRYVLTTSAPIILFSDDPELLMEYAEYPVVAGTAQITQKGLLRCLPRTIREIASRILGVVEWFTAGGYDSVNSHSGSNSNNISYRRVINQAFCGVSAGTVVDPDPIFEVFLNVSNITENSAYLKGRIVYGINHIMPVEMGYVYKISDGPDHIVEDMNFYGKTVSGLQKATKYTVYAYAKTLGDLVKSPAVTFWTLGFDAFPTSLEFPADGDSKPVALLYSESDVTGWDITSKPSWCSITKDSDKMFTVTVGKTTESRTGSITVTAHSMALGSLTQNITVSQRGSNDWDGTSWVFSGPITYNTNGQISVDNYECTLVINSVANKDIVFSFAQQGQSAYGNGYSDNYSLEGNGNLLYTANGSTSMNGISLHANSRVTFTRTGPTTATANLNLYEAVSSQGITSSGTASGVLQGTLVNAKDINMTAIDYKNSIFLNKRLTNFDKK